MGWSELVEALKAVGIVGGLAKIVELCFQVHDRSRSPVRVTVEMVCHMSKDPLDGPHFRVIVFNRANHPVHLEAVLIGLRAKPDWMRTCTRSDWIEGKTMPLPTRLQYLGLCNPARFMIRVAQLVDRPYNGPAVRRKASGYTACVQVDTASRVTACLAAV